MVTAVCRFLTTLSGNRPTTASAGPRDPVGAAASMSASLQNRRGERLPRHARFVPILLQKSFCTGDQKFSGLQTRLSCKDVGDLIALTGDLGSVIETTQIGGRRSDRL